ncbi:prepilin peptidase [Aerococcaceae bacterium WGS1372]
MIYILFFYFGCSLSSFAFCFSTDWIQRSISFTRRSQCDHCGHNLKAYELIPLVSVFLCGFHCRHCQFPISTTYLFTELFGGLLTLVVYLLFPYHSFIFVISYSLVVLLMIFCDWQSLMVPDLLQVFLLLLCLYDSYILSRFSVYSLLFAFSIFILLMCLNLYKADSIGGADIKTLSILAFMTPLEQFPLVLFISSFFALLYIVVTRSPKEYRGTPLPFIPFIFLGFFVAIGLS